jgi:hypothetical protein
MNNKVVNYELYLFDPQIADSIERARELSEQGSYFETSRPYSDLASRKWRTARALVARHSRLIIHEHDIAAIAKRERKSEQETAAAHPYVHVGDPYGEHAVRMDIFDQVVEIVVESPSTGETADAVVRDLFQYLERLHMEGYSCVYDIQLDRFLDIDKDRPALENAYTLALGPVHGNVDPTASAAVTTQSAKKPWWKFGR